MADDQIVEMPDGKQISFPGDMPDAEIAKHVSRYVGNSGAASPIAPPAGPSNPASKLKMKSSYLVGDESPEDDKGDYGVGDAVVGAAKSAYTASAPNVAHQLVRKAQGKSSDLVSPVENAIGMMAGEEGIMGMGESASTSIPARAAASEGMATGMGRSFPKPRAAGVAASAGKVAGDGMLGDLAKVISPRAAHAADFATKLLRRVGGGNSAVEGAGPTTSAAETGGVQMAPHESTAVPQKFPSTGNYNVSGRPTSSTTEFLGANRPAPAPLPQRVPVWKTDPNVGVDAGGGSAKDVLVKQNTEPQPTSSWANDTKGPDPARGISKDEWDAGHDIPAGNETPPPTTMTKGKSAVTRLLKKSPALVDDAAMAARPQASTEEAPSPAMKLKKKVNEHISYMDPTDETHSAILDFESGKLSSMGHDAVDPESLTTTEEINNPEKAQDYAKMWSEGSEPPAVPVVKLKSGKLAILNGQHRAMAAKIAGKKVPVEIFGKLKKRK